MYQLVPFFKVGSFSPYLKVKFNLASGPKDTCDHVMVDEDNNNKDRCDPSYSLQFSDNVTYSLRIF